MLCPNCGDQGQQVFLKPHRFDAHDLRAAQCSRCGLQMELITQIRGVYVFNPITEEREFVPLQRFKEQDYPAVIRGKKPHPATESFEQEHGHG